MKKGLRAVAGVRPPRKRVGPSIGNGPKAKSSHPNKTARRENLQDILNSSGIATLVVDRNLKLRFFTPVVTLLFKALTSDLGRPISEISRRFADDDLLLDIQTVIATSVSLWREVEADSGAWYNRRLLPYRTEENDIQGVVITFADISEMKAAEQETEAARVYSNSIVDTIRQPLVVLDHELRIVSASPSFYRSFAILPVSAVGWTLPQIRDRCLDVQALRNFLDRIAAGSDVAEDYEIQIELPPRGRRVLQLNAREIPAVYPGKKKTLLAIDDITDRKHAEAAVGAAKKEAERANLAKSRFLAAASHDLRQPLQTLALLQGVLAAKVKDTDALKLIARLGESLDVMSGMLNKLLDINELEAGIVNAAVTAFSIDEVLGRLRGEFADHAAAKGLRCHVVSSNLTVRSDPGLLEQMIRNLLSNALKYTDQGKILLGCRRLGDRLRIEVWDTGSGIPEGELDAVFEEFHQLDNPARERSRGLGLGLAIVQRLADLLGHTIDVRSRPGKGSVFSIEVPCIAGKVDAVLRSEPQAAEHIGAGESILIIEDDPTIREMLQLLFEIDGYRVTAAADGKSALDLVRRRAVRPGIVIADYNLPNGLTGLEVAARLRETFDPALPVLIVTGDISTDTLRAISTASCVQLNKPIRADELSRLVRTQLSAPRRKFDERSVQSSAASAAVDNGPTVFLIDDDAALRAALRDVIAGDGRRVEAFASCEAFLEAYRPDRKGCLLVDARLRGMGGLALLQQLKAEHHGLPSIMITGHGEVSMAVEAMKAGAIDFIEKPVSHDALLASVERALELSRDSTALSSWRDAAATRIGSLTRREREIMDLVITGHPNKIIADDLGVSQRTVENHRAAVMRKTRSKSLSDLVRLAHRCGLTVIGRWCSVLCLIAIFLLDDIGALLELLRERDKLGADGDRTPLREHSEAGGLLA
jgi:two-component system CheB/CheR fusion protein